MSNEGYMNQMVMCVNAIKNAIALDKAKIESPRKRKDGSAEWSAAAYYFSRANNLDVALTNQQMRELYYNCSSYLE